ncbi:MAG: hypothetical protein C0425_08600 [Chlorobiaceae bacterium]|nr:hypothetical protein [Chlorobiaceae bacterium]MBA4310380.1 hypothetical protein [Chlorobiaceae bacterium]
MKNIIYKIGLLFSIFALFLVIGCAHDAEPSLFDPNDVGRPQPVIDSISPKTVGLSGLTIFTIYGKNFSPVAEENSVFFNSSVGSIRNATSTQIEVQAPNVPGDSIRIKLSVFRAEKFSNTVLMRLLETQKRVFDFKDFQLPLAIEFDASNNMYVSVLERDITNVVLRITPAGVVTDHSARVGGGLNYTSLKFGPSAGWNGNLFGVRNSQRAIFRLVGGGAAAATFVALPAGENPRLTKIDFDSRGFLWAVGNQANIYRVASNATFVSFPFTANLRAVRVFNNFLYVAGEQGTSPSVQVKIWRFPIDANNNLGAAEEYFDLKQINAAITINDFAFAADGTIYIATALSNPIHEIKPDKSFSVLYPTVIPAGEVLNMSWNSDKMYYTRIILTAPAVSPQTVFQLEMEKLGAPFFGR